MTIAMHADADHHGALPGIKNAAPGALLACHEEDLKLIENPEYLYQHRYYFLAHDHGLGIGREGTIHCPEGRRIDVVLKAGETLQFAPDWELRVWHVPGHSAGHLAIYEEKHRAAFTSDAVQGGGYPTTDGKMAFGPTCCTVDAYLSSIQFLENMPIEHVFSGHWAALHGPEIRTFLRTSRSFVEETDDLLRAHQRESGKRLTLKQLIHSTSPKLGRWPDDAAPFLQFAVYGHMARLEQRGVVRASKTIPVEYVLA